VDDERIEEMLRESWQPQLPDGMREKVLGRARAEAFRRQGLGWFAVSRRWQTALAVAGVLIVILTAVSDVSRQSRLAAYECREAPRKRMVLAREPVTMAEWRAELDRIIGNPSDGQR